jgi:hypothetical protein
MPHRGIDRNLPAGALTVGARSQRMQQPSELQMDIEVSDLIVGLLMSLFGLIGLIAAAGATDNEMYVFGLSLAGFAVVFVVGLIRRHFDKQDARRRRGADYV